MNSNGIIYVASRRLKFLCEAIASAESAKAKAPDVHITLMTDLPAVVRSRVSPFDQIAQIDAGLPLDDGSDQESWARGLYAKLVGLRQSPYHRTLYLDTDTRILRPELRDVFRYLDDHSMAMVPCTPTTSRDCFLYGPMFSAGVIAYRRDGDITGLFEKWDALHRYHLTLAQSEAPVDVPALSHLSGSEKVRMLVSDQTSLAELVSPCRNDYNIGIKSLDEVWNARGRSRSQLDGVVIDHADCHKVEAKEVGRFLADRGLDATALAARI